MPLGGETVGTAYIRMLADGSGLDESIRREYKDTDPTIRAAGDRHSEEYQQAFLKRLHDQSFGKKFDAALVDALAHGDANNLFRQGSFKKFQQDLEKQYGVLGRRLGQNLDTELARGMTGDQLRHRLQNITAEIAKVEDEMHAEAIRINKSVDQEFTRRAQVQKDRIAQLRLQFSSLNDQVDRFANGERKIGSRKDLLKTLRDLDTQFHNAGIHSREFASDVDRIGKRLLYANPLLERGARHVGTWADRIGAAFGRGSRNNAINFFGAVVRGFVNLLQVPFTVLNKVSDAVNHVRGVFAKASENSGSFVATLSTMGIVGGEVVAGLAAAGGALVAFTLLIGPVVALLSGLLGTVIALAATLSFALVGAIGAVAGALGPLIAGIGVVVFALTTMTKAQRKAFKADLKPLLSGLRQLGGAVRKVLLERLGRQMQALGPVLKGLKPLFVGVANAVADVGDMFIKSLKGKGFKTWRDTFAKFLPDAIRSLGRSFRNFLGGMGGVFRSLIPLTREFLRWLERVTKKFDDFANSKSGQRKMKKFWSDTLASIHSVFHFLSALGRVIGTLFNAGKKTGDNIFDNMANGLDRLNRWMKAHPKGLADFFKNAADTAKSVGKLVKSLSELLDTLDSPQSRKVLGWLMDLLNWTVQSSSFVIAATNLNTFTLAINKFKDAIDTSKKIDWSKVLGIDAVSNVDWGATFSKVPGAIQRELRGVLKTMSTFGPKLLVALVSPLSGLGTAIAGVLSHAFSGGGGAAGGLVKRIVGSFSGIAGKIAKAFIPTPGNIRKNLRAAIPAAVTIVRGIVHAFGGIAGKIARTFAPTPGNVRKYLSRVGSLAAPVVRTVVHAFVGIAGKIAGTFAPTPGNVRKYLNRLVPGAGTVVGNVVQKFTGIAGKIAGKFSGTATAVGRWLSGIPGKARTAASNIVDAFRGLAGRILAAIGSVIIHPTIGSLLGHLPKFHAAGGVVEGLRGIGVPLVAGEAGAEAVVPLDRPLSQVDPAVRMLSAFAQGKMKGMASGGVVGSGRTVDASGWTIVSPNTNTEAVAASVVNRLATVGGF